MSRDLLLSHPDPDHVHIVPTARDVTSGLALSSRNAYLTQDGRKVASALYKALTAAKMAWDSGLTKAECVDAAVKVVEAFKLKSVSDGLSVEMRLDYVELNNLEDFEVVDPQTKKMEDDPRPVILSGALWLDGTRLIDNVILGDESIILGR